MQKLIAEAEEVINDWDNDGFCPDYEECIELIQRLTDALREREWKLIDKDTPHDGTMLLLSDNRPKHFEDKWVVAGSYETASKKTGYKKAGWYNQFETECTIYPTHWQPMPQPPEEV
jgi:hypothetical protein